MASQPIASTRPAPSAPGSARHRRIRTAAAITATAVLLATGGYLATTTSSPDITRPTPATGTGTGVNPSAQTMRDLHQSVAGQYGNPSAAGAMVNPSAQTMRDLRASVVGQYASRPAAGAVVNPSAQVRRELRNSVAGQYGPAR